MWGSATLNPGGSLLPGQFIIATRGQFKLEMQTDGNLVLSQQTHGVWHPYWATGTNGHDRTECVLSTGGELLVGYPNSPALWSSGTARHPGSHLVIQDDGSLVIYFPNDPIWSTGTNVPLKPPGPPAGPNKGPYLRAGQALMAGEQLVSPNQRYRFVLQSDGNLVLYDIDHATWLSDTYGSRVVQCDMQPDSNLVVYGPDGAVWSSGTNGRDTNAYLRIQDDGNAVIYGQTAIWAQHR